MQSKLVILLLGILLSLTLAGSLTVESRKRKEISCYPLAEVKFTTACCSLCRYVIRSRNNLDPEGSWRYVKWEESPEWHQRQWNGVRVAESTGRPGVLCCALLPEDLSPLIQCLAQRAFGSQSSAGCQTRAICLTWHTDHCEECNQSTIVAFCSLHFQTLSASNRHS